MPVDLDEIVLGSGVPDRAEVGRLAEQIGERAEALCKRTTELHERIEAAHAKFRERALGD